MIARSLGTMIAFEGVVALALFAFGKLAPTAKAEVATTHNSRDKPSPN